MNRTRQGEREIPAPQSPWDEIVPGLWMGGHYWSDPFGRLRRVVVGAEFELVVSLFTRSGHGPRPDIEHLVAEIPDGPLSPLQIEAVQAAALSTAQAVKDGRTTLVRCHSGYNRSGLVVAQALIELGRGAESAVELVRRRRSPFALNNETFTDYLGTGLEVAGLLAGLEDPSREV